MANPITFWRIRRRIGYLKRSKKVTTRKICSVCSNTCGRRKDTPNFCCAIFLTKVQSVLLRSVIRQPYRMRTYISATNRCNILFQIWKNRWAYRLITLMKNTWTSRAIDMSTRPLTFILLLDYVLFCATYIDAKAMRWVIQFCSSWTSNGTQWAFYWLKLWLVIIVHFAVYWPVVQLILTHEHFFTLILVCLATLITNFE